MDALSAVGLPHHNQSIRAPMVVPGGAMGSRYHPQPGVYAGPGRIPIDPDALAAGVQRYIPTSSGAVQGLGHAPHYSHPHAHAHAANSYIALPPGVDPATVDFRTFYPYNPSEVKHRKRTTRPQQKVLEETFKKETKPNANLRKELAKQLGMTPRGVQVWFQNRRAKEKNLAKKASAAGKSITTIDRQCEDTTVDADCDADHDEDEPSGNANLDCPSLATGSSASGSEQPEAEVERSLSSNSTDSSSPEATPPSITVDVPPHVNVSPPDDDVVPSSIESKRDLMNGTGAPLSGSNPSMSTAGSNAHVDGRMQGYVNGNLIAPPNQYVRRVSLPTHLELGPSRTRPGHNGAMRAMNSNYASLGSSRPAAFDPNARRLSLDRLATHPYAHLAVQANSAVYGPSATARYRPSLPVTTAHSTPTVTPQANPSDLPQVPGNSAATEANAAPAPLPEVSHNMHAHHGSLSPPTNDVRPDLRHRQSLPAQFIQTRGIPNAQPGPLTSSQLHARFPRSGHVYAIPHRTYQPPIPGPLPNPDFSFGSPNSTVKEEVENTSSDGGASGSGTPAGQTQNYQFPPPTGSTKEGDPMSTDGDVADTEAHMGFTGLSARSAAFFRTHHGGLDPYAHRFGSIASIAESESSVASAYYSESGSYDVQTDAYGSSGPSPGVTDARRPSYTGQMMGMFANLGVQNDSSSSLSHESAHISSRQEVPISKSSELALALSPESRISPQTSAHNAETSSIPAESDSHSFTQSRSSTSSDAYYLSSHPSASSSQSSLGMHPPAPPRLETEKLDFMHSYEAVSETGHYSPVVNAGQGAFEFPPSTSCNLGASQSVVSLGATSMSSGHDDNRGELTFAYPVDDQAHQQTQQQHLEQQTQQHMQMHGPYGTDGVYQMPTYSHAHSAESVAQYGYYS